MKLRFRKNSLRLRVNRIETEQLASGSALREQVTFPGDQRMQYVLQSCPEPAPTATFQEGVICVSAPETQLRDWAKGDEIGMYFELRAGDAFLKVAIEKDLECIDGPPEERDPDAFPRIAGAAC